MLVLGRVPFLSLGEVVGSKDPLRWMARFQHIERVRRRAPTLLVVDDEATGNAEMRFDEMWYRYGT